MSAKTPMTAEEVLGWTLSPDGFTWIAQHRPWLTVKESVSHGEYDVRIHATSQELAVWLLVKGTVNPLIAMVDGNWCVWDAATLGDINPTYLTGPSPLGRGRSIREALAAAVVAVDRRMR